MDTRKKSESLERIGTGGYGISICRVPFEAWINYV